MALVMGIKVKIVLIETSSYFSRKNPFSHIDRILEPLAIEYIGAHLQACGHEVKLIQQLALQNEEIINCVIQEDPELVGFSCMTYSYPETLCLAQIIKKELPEVQTVLGGYHVLGMESGPECFDFIVKGEGEIALEQILKFMSGKKDIHNIPGLQYYRGKHWDIPMERCDVKRLENPLRLPRESFCSKSMGENMPDTRIACVMAGRGCPYRCDFCCTPQLFPGRKRYRPVKDVVSEIIMLRDELGVNIINIRDETFTPNKDYVKSFCEEMINRRANVSWRAFANIGNVNKDMLNLMAESGCHMLFYGIEASDKDTLKIRRKNFTARERIIKDIKMTQEAGIYVRAGFIVGHENDGYDSFTRHLAFLCEVIPDELCLSFLTPFPGTPLYQTIKESGRLLTTDYTRYDCEHPIVDIGIPEEDLIDLRNQLYKDFYTSTEWTRHIVERVERNPQGRDEIERFVSFVSKEMDIQNVLHSKELRKDGACR